MACLFAPRARAAARRPAVPPGADGTCAGASATLPRAENWDVVCVYARGAPPQGGADVPLTDELVARAPHRDGRALIRGLTEEWPSDRSACTTLRRHRRGRWKWNSPSLAAAAHGAVGRDSDARRGGCRSKRSSTTPTTSTPRCVLFEAHERRAEARAPPSSAADIDRFLRFLVRGECYRSGWGRPSALTHGSSTHAAARPEEHHTHTVPEAADDVAAVDAHAVEVDAPDVRERDEDAADRVQPAGESRGLRRGRRVRDQRRRAEQRPPPRLAGAHRLPHQPAAADFGHRGASQCAPRCVYQRRPLGGEGGGGHARKRCRRGEESPHASPDDRRRRSRAQKWLRHGVGRSTKKKRGRGNGVSGEGAGLRCWVRATAGE